MCGPYSRTWTSLTVQGGLHDTIDMAPYVRPLLSGLDFADSDMRAEGMMCTVLLVPL